MYIWIYISSHHARLSPGIDHTAIDCETGDSLGLAGEALLWLAVALTWVTAANYVQASLRHFSKPSTSDGDSAS